MRYVKYTNLRLKHQSNRDQIIDSSMNQFFGAVMGGPPAKTGRGKYRGTQTSAAAIHSGKKGKVPGGWRNNSELPSHTVSKVSMLSSPAKASNSAFMVMLLSNYCC
eukprot:3757238-Amphidinium_carterae.1